MIENLKAKPGVIALRVTGHLSRQDVDSCYEQLFESFENHPSIGLYVEVTGLTGFDTEAFQAELKMARTLLGKLDRFGRVAIVSDDNWIRWASRLESALLPGISYRTYKVSEREQALDWVQGREDLPYGHAVKVIETTRSDVIGVEVDGRVTAEEMAQVAAVMNERRAQGLKRVLVRFGSLTGFDPGIAAIGDYWRFKLGLIGELDRYAVVGGPHWIETWLKLWQPLLKMELRHFEVGDEAAAWTWLGAEPLADRPIAA